MLYSNEKTCDVFESEKNITWKQQASEIIRIPIDNSTLRNSEGSILRLSIEDNYSNKKIIINFNKFNQNHRYSW